MIYETLFTFQNTKHLGIKDAIVIVIFGILLPTTDVYSDVAFITFLFFGDKGFHPKYAIVMICPLALSFVFTLIQYFGIEKHKLRVLPLLLLQIWPQYLQCRLLYWIWKKNEKKYDDEKFIVERNVSSIGIPFFRLFSSNRKTEFSFQNVSWRVCHSSWCCMRYM